MFHRRGNIKKWRNFL